jgi:hypothetical protein
MQELRDRADEQYMLDGNAVAGLLHEVFGMEMTVTPAQCAHCGMVSEVGAMLAFGLRMGTVLRCPICENVMMRLVERTDEVWIDMQGVSCIRMERADR